MRRPSIALLAVFIGVALGGCSRGTGTTTAPPSSFLSLGTAPPGGAFFVVGGALAEVLGAHSRDLGWTVTAEATKGSQENIRRLGRGELDFALSNSAVTYFAVRGTEGWEQPHDVRSVMTLAPNVALFVAPRSAGVSRIADLKGKRVVLGPAGAGFEFFLKPILAAHGLSFDDLSALYNTQSAAVDMLTDGSAAAAFLGGAIPTGSITQAATSLDLVFVPFEEEARRRLIDEHVFFRAATIPAGTYRGQDADFTALDVGSMHLITSAGADPERVYRVAKILYENRAEIVQKHAAGRAIQPANIVRDTGTEFHPGAVRYYREIGIWPQ